MGGRARVAARCVTNRFWFMVWRDTGASARATVRAAAKRRPPEKAEVERRNAQHNEAGGDVLGLTEPNVYQYLGTC